MSTALSVRQLTLFKHGICVVVRRGAVTGEQLTLTVHRDQMNDLLKSLVALDHQGGQVRQLAFEAQEDRALKLSRVPIQLGSGTALVDLLRSLRGHPVRLQVDQADHSTPVEGLVVGLDITDEKPFKTGRVTLRTNSGLRVLLLSAIRDITLLDAAIQADLDYVLDLVTAEPEQRAVTVRLSEGEHDIELRYLLPSPTWRVSYRFVGDKGSGEALVQGWAIIDNPLDEPLNGVQLSLVSGMPISFIYDLYSPFTPERPRVEEEARVAAAPIAMERGVPRMAKAAFAGAAPAPMMTRAIALEENAAYRAADAMEASTAIAAQGEAQGDLFAYHIDEAVDVARGEAAMVPILSARFGYQKEYIFNEEKMARHPSVVLRFRNSSGLTLERGPITVSEAESYLGEAIFPFTRPNAEVLLAIAIDLGVTVRTEQQTERAIVGVTVDKGFLIVQQMLTLTTQYEVRNQNEEAVALLIEHPRRPGFEPFQMDDPEETTETHYRWRLAVAAGPEGEGRFVVTERRLEHQRHAASGIDQATLNRYLRNRWLDEAIGSELQRLLALDRELAQIGQQLTEVAGQRQQLLAAQEQMRKNLGSLRDSGEEAALRSRYVSQLAESEDQLAALAERQRTLETARGEREVEKQHLLAALGSE
ncbi:MAG: hypothetical protein KDD73_13510 [Anaerolineales bacterium]|nr:hypothetical protein [Anaerolineales bacterium]MCB9128036.1 hypothetical protein [Ardenticatenales bacterium]